ncbi:serine-rich adhesin for platelets-like [Plodia interpunctella]|uniref:serine-rich adhesin for platelets-like n=1 Tax=Plodia interpunctella TaxID=58824 RepID=UPI0023683455|nr:serine-rich adhesin for platelets-like [Plodia interpunctella]
MELKCAVVFTLVSLLLVTANPHGYDVKGGAAARAEASAAAGAFGVAGLPLSIQTGPGFSGSFSKSSSSSFASSSASSSSSSFSFSGSGAGGVGLNSLGNTGSGVCSGGCQSDSKGINDSNGIGSPDLQTITGVKSNAAAGASAGSYINSKDGDHRPCSSGNCPVQCAGPNCKDASESEATIPESAHKECASGQCNNDNSKNQTNCENGNCSGNNNKPASSYDANNCASGKCGPPQTTGDFGTNGKCTSGKCLSGPSTKLERDDGSTDISVDITSSTTSLDSSSQSDTATTSTISSQASGVDCKNGNCDSLTPSTKPGYSSSISYNENQPLTTVPANKPATDLIPPKEEEPCTHPNCKTPQLEGPKSISSNVSPGKNNCAGGYCDNGQSHNYPRPISINEYSSKGEPKIPSYVQVPTDQKSNNIYPSTNCVSGNCVNPSNSIPLLPKLPDNSQTHSPAVPHNCVIGNCGSSSSYQTSPNNQVYQAPTPTQSQELDFTPNCYSGNCNSSPKQPIGIPYGQPTISNYPKPTPNVNCPSGNCGNPFNASPSQSKIPNFPQGQLPTNDCASGNCGTYPSYQNNIDINVSKIPIQSHVTEFSKPSYPVSSGTTGPIPSLQSSTNLSNCANGNCHSSDFVNSKPTVPGYSQGPFPIGPSHCQSGTCNSYPSTYNVDSSFPRLPSYPQNILPRKPLNCVSGNCANYPSIETKPSISSSGSKLPHPFDQPSGSASPTCVSGNCGNNPQQGSFGSSGYKNLSYSGAIPSPSCASGNCAINPSTSVTPGPQIPLQGIGSTGYTSSTGLFSSGASLTTGSVSSSGNCDSGKCPNYPSTQPISYQPQPASSNSPVNIPHIVALGSAGGVLNTGSFVPPSLSPSKPSISASHTTANSGVAAGSQSQSSVLSNVNNKEEVYTGGFGGPPGILKPHEFTAPSPQLPSGNNNDQGHRQCSTGKCDTHSEEDGSNPSGTRPCTSGKCGTQNGKPHYGQNTASGAFAVAAAGSEGVLYTEGFGGPPGILKPFDGGKIGNIAAIKHQIGASLGSNNDAVSGNKLNGGYGVFSGAAASANAGIFGSGSYGDHNKAGGCNSGCGTSGHDSYGGNFGVAGGLSKSGLLEKLHNGLNGLGALAQSAAGAVGGAGASSYAVGGSFAGSSASAHSVAGSATKGGYGR